MIRLFKVSVPVTVLGLLTSETAVFFGAYVLACYWELRSEAGWFLTEANGAARIAPIAVAFVFGMYLADLYTQLRVRSTFALAQRLMSVVGAAVICEALVGYASADWALPKSIVFTGTFFAFFVIALWRIIYGQTLLNGFGSKSILFVGSSPLVATISRQLRENPELGLNPAGYVAENAVLIPGLPWLGELSDVGAAVERVRPHRVVIAMNDRRAKLPVNELMDVRFSGVFVEEVPRLYEEVFGRVCVDEIRPSNLILSTELGPRPWTVRLQAVYSTLIALGALLVLAPVLLLIAVAIRLSSPGPIFYRQRRVGLNGKVFEVYKFRSMYQDAEARTGAVWATKNDPRITPFGRFLRKSRLDEVPQLFNVLHGDMSIVGPRPERPEFVEQLQKTIPFYRQRHCVKPGITGWAQVSHQYSDTLEGAKTKLEYDLYYIKNLSPSFDAYIMFHTFKIMVLSRGAQ